MNFPQRKNIRLKGYDYSQAGYYFITICTKDRLNLFGSIVGADDSVRPKNIQMNEIGEIINKCWNEINRIHIDIKTDVFCLMPNHIHGIIFIGETGGQGRPPLHKIIQATNLSLQGCALNMITGLYGKGDIMNTSSEQNRN